MATTATINIDALLAPISDSAPCGVNLRTDASPTSLYYRLKDARSGARAAERRLDGEGAAPAGLLPEWQSILSLAPQALAEKSKDLEVAVWLIEGLVRAQGFAGLRDGFKVVHGLLDRYWSDYFSLEDEEGLATRLAPLAGLNGQGSAGTLYQPLRKVPLTAGHDAAFAVYQYEQARALARLNDAAAVARREAAGEVTMERFRSAVNASGGLFYISLLDDLDACLEEIGALAAVLRERAARDAPPTSDIAAVLTTIRDEVREFSADLVAQARAAMAVDETPPVTATSGGAPGSVKAAGAVSGRDEALRNLQMVAEFFRKNEPHSPISTCLDEIVRRARMPFSELLAELLPDPTAWRSALISAGIKPPE